jgi:hypothetical protein
VFQLVNLTIPWEKYKSKKFNDLEVMWVNFKQLEQLGDQLRGIGHKRRQLVEQICQEVQEGDQQASKELYEELSSISDQAIGIIQHQKQLFDEEVSRM